MTEGIKKMCIKKSDRQTDRLDEWLNADKWIDRQTDKAMCKYAGLVFSFGPSISSSDSRIKSYIQTDR